MNKVTLQYLTDRGFDWLNEAVEFKDDDYKYVIDQYVLKNRVAARHLLKKWESDGEDVTFFVDVDNINCKPVVMGNMMRYIEELEDQGQTL